MSYTQFCLSPTDTLLRCHNCCGTPSLRNRRVFQTPSNLVLFKAPHTVRRRNCERKRCAHSHILSTEIIKIEKVQLSLGSQKQVKIKSVMSVKDPKAEKILCLLSFLCWVHALSSPGLGSVNFSMWFLVSASISYVR